MALVLVATQSGCRVFTESGENRIELAGKQVCALASDPEGSCIAIVDGKEIWRRGAGGEWSHVTTVAIPLLSIVSVKGTFYCGTLGDASLVRILPNGEAERLEGFDQVEGRKDWIASGPPVHVRALTGTADGGAILAAVHVGGMPRSVDGGKTWVPTIPILHDVHQVKGHPTLPNIVAAAAAAGLCVSSDGGQSWMVLSEGLAQPSYCLAVALTEDEVLFSHEDGPFAKRSQIWRWPVQGGPLEQVRDGLPEWLEGKVDTHRMAAQDGRVAVLDHGGNLWLSKTGSRGWKRIATGVENAFGVLTCPRQS